VATIIKLKRSTTASSVPTTSDLTDGEVAVNVADRKLYVRNGASIVEVANNTKGAGGGTDLTNISSSLLPDTDETYNVGSLTAAFNDIFFSGDVKNKVNIFTASGGLSTPSTQFAFSSSNRNIFENVFTNSGGLGSSAISNTTFDDNNPAYRF